MEKVFIDTDVILDFLINREPFALDAAKILALSESKKIEVCTTGLVFANAYYILRKLATHRKVIEKLSQLSQIVDIIGMPKIAVLNALQSDFNDFEDALQHFSASESKIKIIISRNVKDYKKSTLPVMTPDLFLKQV